MRETEKRSAELLSPAGNLETLKAVAAAGADAVYAAGTSFGARAYAGNLTEEELLYAIDYLHLHGKRLYLTVNTLLKETELRSQLYNYILPLYRQGLDGVIVQDIGVLTFLREHFPGMELHASTQMTITGPEGAAMMKELGCNRIVTARELSLAEIKEIHDTVDIEIESFIHGALCYCYSGQCLFSSILGGRSGNRGRCAQPCRLPYRTGDMPEAYLLSPKDLCTIELLPQILESGVYSLKIEGRMKQAEYAAGVTSVYREYLDRYLEHPEEEYRVLPEDLKRLTELGSRSGFTGGYYIRSNGPDMMAMKKPAHTRSNDALQEEMRRRFLHQEIQEKMNGILRLSKGFPAELVLQCKGEQVSVAGDMVQKAKSRPMDADTIEEKMKKTGGSGFEFDRLDLEMEEDIFIPVGALNQLRRDGIALLKERLLKKYRRTSYETEGEFSPDRKTETCIDMESGEFSNRESEIFSDSAIAASNRGMAGYLAVSVQTPEQCQQILSYPYVDRIYIDCAAFEGQQEHPQDNTQRYQQDNTQRYRQDNTQKYLQDNTQRYQQDNTQKYQQEYQHLAQLVSEVHEAGKQLFYVMPAVMRGSTTHWYREHIQELLQTNVDGFVAGNYEALHFLDYSRKEQKNGTGKQFRILTDSSLYAWSAEAEEALKEAGADEITLPIEANERELKNRVSAGGELIIYGYLPLMISAQCLLKNTTGCVKKAGYTSMTDRYGKTFTVRNRCSECCNIIYNSSPLSLLHQYAAVKNLKTNGLRISFTIESRKQIAEIMSYYEQGFLRKERIDMNHYLKDFTNGHFKRGVE